MQPSDDTPICWMARPAATIRPGALVDGLSRPQAPGALFTPWPRWRDARHHRARARVYLKLSQASGAPRDRGTCYRWRCGSCGSCWWTTRASVWRSSVRRAAKVSLDDDMLEDAAQSEQMIEIDAALRRLAELEPRQAAVFECATRRLNDEETATALGISPRTAHRDWDAARAWLAAQL